MQGVADGGWMLKALDLAREAEGLGEVPVGALIVFENQIISSAYNRRETDLDPLAHAELRAIHEASQKLKRWRLIGCTLYVTLEPCVMCAGAIVNSRIDRVVFGATDPKAGAVESLYQVLSDKRLNHRPEVSGGVLREECSKILTEFFRNKRQTQS